MIGKVNLFKKKSEPVYIYGIRRSLTAQSPAWERTDDAIGLTANAQIGTTTVTNDFDSLYPWSDIITANVSNNGTINAYYGDSNFAFDGTNGHVMTIFPKIWLKRWQDSSYEYIQIATGATEGFTEYDSFMLGRYTMSGSTSAVTSKSGVIPLVRQNITTFRQSANALGTGWGQLDWHYFLIQYLYLVEYADYDSQTKLGEGWTSQSSLTTSGSCDFLGMKSGRPAGTDGYTSIIYRGLEDIFGNIYQFLDGLNIDNRVAYICYDPTKYAVNITSGDYTALGYTNSSSDGYIYKLGYDANNPLIALPTETGSIGNRIPDRYNQAPATAIVAVGGNWSSDTYAGLWYLSCIYTSSYTNTYLGARLLKY